MTIKKVYLSCEAGTVKLDHRFKEGFKTLCGEKSCEKFVPARMRLNMWIGGLCREHFQEAITEIKK